MSAATTTPNLHQRIAAITEKAGLVDATGHNQYQAKALSIEDVENALRPAFTEHGVTTHWGFRRLEDIGNGKLWLAHVAVTVTNADAPDDSFTDEAMDVGTTPSAAVSFAIKRYYKALFHIAENDEQEASRGQTSERRSFDAAPSATSGTPPAPGNGKQPPRPQPTKDNLMHFLKSLASVRGKGEQPADILKAGEVETGIGRVKPADLKEIQIAKLIDWAQTQITLLQQPPAGAEAVEEELTF